MHLLVFMQHLITKMKKINTIRAGMTFLGISGFFLMTPISFAATVIPIPFTSQAPAGNWTQPWQDFCEEASIVMSAHFLWNAPLTSRLAETQMQLIKQYEELVFKKYNDTSADETASILKNLYGFKNIETRHIDSVSDITKELSQAHIVLVPAAGRLLHNPYFIAPGPLYHMVLIRGFDDVKHTFIVNDPGTRRGNGFVYDQELLFRAIHDWNGGDVMRGEKNVVVVGK